MNISSILKADLLDIIFEHRNKDYGAYPLRKYYHERLYKALGITFLIISILSVFILLYKQNVVITSPFEIPETGPTPRKITPEKKILPPAVKPKQPKQKDMATQNFSIIKMVDSTDQIVKPIKNLDSAAISTLDSDGQGNTKKLLKTVLGNEPIQANPDVSVIKIDRNKPLMAADSMPSFPGGMDALINFLQKNLRNPRDLEEDEVVSVKIQFIVGYDGILRGFETVEDGGAAFNNEVIRVLRKMPVWKPGKTAGENVPVFYNIPVKFISQQ